MGLFDQIAGAATSALSGQDGGSHPAAHVLQLIQDGGGVETLIQKFRDQGLTGVIESWISSERNQPISAEQIEQVLGSGPVAALAGRLGIDPSQASAKLAELLPQVVDHLTPDGKLPAGGDLMTAGMELLKGKLFG